MHIASLTCEYLTNPLGIDVHQPRFNWKLITNKRGAKQTAYQILVASSADKLAINDGDLWDSGKVASGQSVHVGYAGLPLKSGQRAWWKVRVWDETREVTEYSAPAWWEMGLLERGEWQAQWAGSAVVGGVHTSAPCPYLRKPFHVSGSVIRARLYITALGLYEAYLNGRPVNDLSTGELPKKGHVFAPGWTDYRRRVPYQVYDVTDSIRTGENVIGAILGDGWYCGFVGWQPRQMYGDRPKLLAQLMLTFADGSTQTIVTDSSWKTTTGPILEADMLMGESYDARLELGAWSEPGFDDSRWQPVELFPDPGIDIVATHAHPVRATGHLTAAQVWESPGSKGAKWVFDFGQNLVGRVRLKVTGKAGTTITLRHAEMLNPDGTIYTENLRTAKQTDHYTLKGDGEEIYEPRFTFHGFRYVEVSGYRGKPPEDMLTAVVLHSDLPLNGSYECSHPLVNQLQHNIQWGQKGNFLEVPTDCPQRNERLGWTGDAQVFVRTAAFNMNVAAFFTKWQQDMADAQYENGAVPTVAPDVDRARHGGPAWSDAIIICPWTMYLCYGDTRLLENHYASMQRFIDFLIETSPGYIRSDPTVDPWGGYGDWLATNAGTPKDLIGTAFFAYSAKLLSQIARVIGKEADADRYARLYEEVKHAFQHRFVSPAGFVVGNTQTAYILALYFDLLPEEVRPTAVDALVRDIEQREMHLSTGFVGTPYILHVLTRFGKLDVAYALLNQKTYPSWLYPVTQGATTIWERWDGWTHDKGFQDARMNSFNHYAYGAVGDWLYSTVAGLEVDAAQPGYQRIVFRPRPGGGLRHARVAYESLYGNIVSAWKVEQGQFYYDVTVPPNTAATVYMPAADQDSVTENDRPASEAEGVKFLRYEPGAAVYEVVSGEYHFRAPSRYEPPEI